MRLTLFNGQIVEKPLKLAAVDTYGLGISDTWPFESTSLQPPVVEPEPVAVPVQNLESVQTSITEHEQAIRERIKLKLATDYSRKTVDGFTHIGRSAGKIYTFRDSCVQHDLLTTCRTSFNKDLSKPDLTSMRAEPIQIAILEFLLSSTMFTVAQL